MDCNDNASFIHCGRIFLFLSNIRKKLIQTESPTPVPCMLVMSDTHLVIGQEGAKFYIDGFARSLSTVSIKDIASVLMISTESHYVLLLQREKGSVDWLFLRSESELKRLIRTFETRWRLIVEDCSQSFELPYSRYYKQCIEMPDYWNNVSAFET